MPVLSSRRSLLALPVALTVASCASPPPSLYTLAIVPGIAQPGGARIVVLRQVSLARYLERPQIVRSSENYRLDVLSNDWWGEPLGPMIGRVLAEDLTQRLPGTTIFSESGAISPHADATVEINILRMGLDASGALAFTAQAAVEASGSRHPPVTRTVNTTIPAAMSPTAVEVRAISIAIGRLADAIADMLRGIGAGP
ncbi:MAG: PqiC family protein [Acetobacteraceae bacterium]